MNWREEQRRLNEFLRTRGKEKATGMGQVTIRAKANKKRKGCVEANRRWRKRNPAGYKKCLRLDRERLAKSRMANGSGPSRKAKLESQLRAMLRYFLCQNKPSSQPQP